MPNVGIMASSNYVAAATCTDVLSEPFNDLTAWTLVDSPTIVAGRTGTALQLASNLTEHASYSIPAINESDTITFGFAYKTSILNTAIDILELRSDSGATRHNRLTLGATGSLTVSRDATGIGSSPIGTIVANTWAYVELKIKLHDTVGYFSLRVNGLEVSSGSSLDTKNAGTKTTYDQIRFVSPIGNATYINLIDDLYISTGPGCAFKGDQVIGTCTDVLTEPFNDFTTNGWVTAGAASIVSGRTGTAAQIAGNSANNAYYAIPAPSESDTITVGTAWKWTDVNTLTREMFRFMSDAGATLHNKVYQIGSEIGVSRNVTGIGTTTGLGLVVNTWYYIEVTIKLHDTAGYFIVRVNGVEKLNISSLDTKNAGTKTTYDRILIGGNVAGSTCQWDDLYLSTGSGCAFKGDHPVCEEILLEPFDNLTAWTVDGSAGTTIAAGRNGTAARVVGGGPRYSIPAAKQAVTYTVGFAYRVSSLASARTMIQFRNAANSLNYFALVADIDGAITAQRGGSTYQTSGIGKIVINIWAYVEMKLTISNTIGALEVRVNGETVIGPFTGIDTNGGFTEGEAPALVALVGTASGEVSEYDDFYLTSGGCDFKGDLAPLVCNNVLTETFNNLTAWSPTTGWTVATGRSGTAAHNGATDTMDFRIPALQESDYITVGFAYKTSGTLANGPMIWLGSDAGATMHIGLSLRTIGSVRLVSGATIFGDSSVFITADTWNYIELQVKLSDTGTFQVRGNGTILLNSTGDTKNGGTKTTFDTVRISGRGAGVTADFDDLYISTGPNCAFRGDPYNFPKTLPNVAAWYEASAAANFTFSGSNITQWTDKSGLNRHLTSTSGWPTRITAGLNHSVVHFPAVQTGTQYAGTALITGTRLSFIAVVRINSSIGGQRVGSFVPSGGNDWQTVAGCIPMDQEGSDFPAAVRAGNMSHATGTNEDTWLIAASIFDGVNHTMYVNNVAQTPVASTGTFNIDKFHIGEAYLGGDCLDGEIAEIVVINGTLTATQRTNLYNYLLNKWIP